MTQRLSISIFAVIAVFVTCLALLSAAPAAATGNSGCISYWYVSYSGTLSYTLLNIDPDGAAAQRPALWPQL